MPIDRNCERKEQKHQKDPDRYANDKPFLEFRIAVCLSRLLIHC